MLINEIFYSIQGESTRAGLPCLFIRLAGCNLDCSWCDTTQAREGGGDEGAPGTEMSIGEVLIKAKKFPCRMVEISGGEPLLQHETPRLIRELLDSGREVLIETNGSLDLRTVDRRAVKVVDVKCPSSGYGDSFMVENIDSLTSDDEIKFVIAGRADYDFACGFIARHLSGKESKILFSPVTPGLEISALADWILDDALRVRLQPQMHKIIWPGGEEGRE